MRKTQSRTVKSLNRRLFNAAESTSLARSETTLFVIRSPGRMRHDLNLALHQDESGQHADASLPDRYFVMVRWNLS